MERFRNRHFRLFRVSPMDNRHHDRPGTCLCYGVRQDALQGSDLLDNRQIKMEADLVVLATAIEPSKDARKLATMLTASMDTNDFFTEAHAKLRPVESPTAGVFLSGVCQGPKDIPETVAQAGAAAVKVVGLLAKDKLTTNPCTAESNPLFCNGCASLSLIHI